MLFSAEFRLRTIFLSALTVGAATVTGLAVRGPAIAHDAPSGWSYPFACCTDFDCRQIETDAITEISDGYLIETSGEVVVYSDSRIRQSPDGQYHWCSRGGRETGHTICLFVPPKMF